MVNNTFVNNTIMKLEDDENYAVIDKIQTEEGFYVYFSNIRDSEGEDICIRKEITEGEEDVYLVPLKDEKEVERALQLLVEKNLES